MPNIADKNSLMDFVTLLFLFYRHFINLGCRSNSNSTSNIEVNKINLTIINSFL